jgi:hypothetical protein
MAILGVTSHISGRLVINGQARTKDFREQKNPIKKEQRIFREQKKKEQRIFREQKKKEQRIFREQKKKEQRILSRSRNLGHAGVQTGLQILSDLSPL